MDPSLAKLHGHQEMEEAMSDTKVHTWRRLLLSERMHDHLVHVLECRARQLPADVDSRKLLTIAKSAKREQWGGSARDVEPPREVLHREAAAGGAGDVAPIDQPSDTPASAAALG